MIVLSHVPISKQQRPTLEGEGVGYGGLRKFLLLVWGLGGLLLGPKKSRILWLFICASFWAVFQCAWMWLWLLMVHCHSCLVGSCMMASIVMLAIRGHNSMSLLASWNSCCTVICSCDWLLCVGSEGCKCELQIFHTAKDVVQIFCMMCA